MSAALPLALYWARQVFGRDIVEGNPGQCQNFGKNNIVSKFPKIVEQGQAENNEALACLVLMEKVRLQAALISIFPREVHSVLF